MKMRMVKKVNVIPSEIVENILSRLPVKTILRFLSVCKSWNSLPHDPYFINIHHKNNPPNHCDNLLLIRQGMSTKIVVMDTSLSVVQSYPQFLGVLDHERSIVGSYNGIACIHGVRNPCFFYGSFNEYFCLWNPLQKTIKSIMNRIGHLNRGEGERAFIGFGFHNHSNDYKVLRFQKSDFSVWTEVEIYSLSLDSWRTVKVSLPHDIRHFFHECFTFASVGVYVNGAHHWAVTFSEIDERMFSTAIVSFDMGEEVFKEIIIPSECKKRNMILFNNNESLAMLTFDKLKRMAHYPSIWVMKDYGLPESWTKLCTIDKPEQLRMDFQFFIRNKNEVILSWLAGGADRSFEFDVDKTVVKDKINSITNIDVFRNASQVIRHRGSLLPLNSTSTSYDSS